MKWYRQKGINGGSEFVDSYWHPECELLEITEVEPQWIVDARNDIEKIVTNSV